MADAAKPETTTPTPTPTPAEPQLKEFTLEEVAAHNAVEDCWIIVKDDGIRKVYDVTAFLDDHPGGPEIIVDLAGQDSTDEFEDIGHSNDARKQLNDYVVGKIKGDVKQAGTAAAAAQPKWKTKTASGRQDISGNNGPLFAVLAAVVAIAALYLKYSKP
jgi:cytochrome b involved in lipid metabolism